MTEFQFEYSRQNIIVRVLIFALTAFLVLFISTFLISKYIGIWTSIILTIGVPILVFYFNKKRIKANEQAILASDRVTFELVDKKIIYDFKDIKSYKIQHDHGVALSLRLKDRTKLRLLANDNFCNPELFSKFCKVFERTIDTYKSNNELSYIREKSIFEKQWYFVLLIFLTIAAIVGLIYALASDKAKSGSIFISIGALISLWTGYFTTKTKRKKSG